MLSKIYLEGEISCGLLDSLVQWIVGFTGPVDSTSPVNYIALLLFGRHQSGDSVDR